MTQKTRQPLTRLEVLAVIAIVILAALLAVGIFDLYDKHFGHSTGARMSGEVRLRSSSSRSSTARKLLTGFRARTLLDTSGFGPMVSTIEPWEPTDPLHKIAENWKQPGLRALAKLEPSLQSARESGQPGRIFNSLMLRAMFLDSEGEPKRAYETLEEARSVLMKDEALERYFLYTVV